MIPPCPVCRFEACLEFISVDRLDYWRCPRCQARFLDPAQRPDRQRERAEYDLHQNSVDDPNYRRFLLPLFKALTDRLPPGSEGLDFGCGPGPALAAMLREAGYQISLFDPFYAPEPGVLERSYDFITCTEVVEHLHHPATVFERLNACLRPGGWLGVMTRFQTEDARFAQWHYRRDPTHVVFYREETFRWLANEFGWQCTITPPDQALLQKTPRPDGFGQAARS